MEADQKRYLELLARSFPTQELAAAEIINLSAILNLPKGTEFFCSDIHGESEAFSHILRNGSGSIRLKVDEAFGDRLTEAEKRELATLIYYPREKAKLILAGVEDERAWYATVVPRLVAVCKRAARKYTASRVRKALPAEFAYIIEELMNEDNHGVDKEAYYAGILDAAVRTGRGIALIEALAQLIQRLAISQLHIIGDIYDRGPQPDVIMETLQAQHNVDIQWGNHDIVWMGAALGQRGCKVWNTDRGYQLTLAAFEKTMTHLGLDYLDLYLIHWPAYADKYENWEDINRETWRAMTELYQSGRVRAIGVSNFKPHHLKALLEGPVKPMVDQIELNPGWQQRETVAFCAQHDILIEAWSPLGRGRVLGHPLLAELGRKYGKTPAQICLRWCLDKGYLPLPKSVTPSRIQENLNIFDFALTPEDIARLDALPPFGESGRDPDNLPF